MLPELDRVLRLPKREPVTEDQIDLLSAHLRVRERDDQGRPNRLRPGQVTALRELYDLGGMVGPIPVGEGKTLITLLAPTLLKAQRPVLIVPASLREKTRRDFHDYSRNWKVRLPTILSYTEMALADRERRLFELLPDLLMLDEADGIRNYDNACARRIERYVHTHRPVFAALSGTLLTDQLADYQHHTAWALWERAPVPLARGLVDRWQDDPPPGYHDMVREVRGVVPLAGSGCGASIQISTWSPTLPGEIKDLISEVTETKMRPDGEPLDDWSLPDCLSQLVMGYYLVWDPLPPTWWLQPRRAWWAYVRAVLEERIEGFDTSGQIIASLDEESPTRRPPAMHEGRILLAAWRAVEEQFTPNPKPVWISDDPIKQAIKRAGKGCLIWTKHTAEGEAMQRLGVAHYGGGTSPELARPGDTISVSLPAHHRGCNLQRGWSRNLILAPPADARIWEQLIGRTHRQGQTASCVDVEIVSAIPYHEDVLQRARAQAVRIGRASGFPQKISLADWI